MDKIEIVIVTGMSGAGKTTAMAAFENMAYRCIDNYPIELLGAFSEYLKDNTAYSRIAMAVSLDDAPKAIRFLSNVDWLNVSVIFLDCDDNIILKRYKETRRSHPILISNKASTLLEAIEYERKLARPISKEANVVIDTTQLKGNKFQQILENQFNHQSIDPFRISFVSFGYKHGIPKDADLLFDVRFLPNPFYVDELRNLTGNDKEVYDYVLSNEVKGTLKLNVKMSLYNNVETNINKDFAYDYTLKDKIGNINTVSISSNEKISKGYIYANYDKKDGLNETIYNENYIIDIAYAGIENELELNQAIDKFEINDEKNISTTVGGTNYTYNKKIKVAEDIFKKMLGKDGKIEVFKTDKTKRDTNRI